LDFLGAVVLPRVRELQVVAAFCMADDAFWLSRNKVNNMILKSNLMCTVCASKNGTVFKSFFKLADIQF